MKTIVVILLSTFAVFAQKPKKSLLNSDDIYGKPLKIKYGTPTAGGFLQKSGNSFAGSILLGMVSAGAAYYGAKENNKIFTYISYGAAFGAVGLQINTYVNISKAGKILQEKGL